MRDKLSLSRTFYIWQHSSRLCAAFRRARTFSVLSCFPAPQRNLSAKSPSDGGQISAKKGPFAALRRLPVRFTGTPRSSLQVRRKV